MTVADFHGNTDDLRDPHANAVFNRPSGVLGGERKGREQSRTIIGFYRTEPRFY